MTSEKLYQCPYEQACKCVMNEPCLGCESFSNYQREKENKEIPFTTITFRVHYPTEASKFFMGCMNNQQEPVSFLNGFIVAGVIIENQYEVTYSLRRVIKGVI